MARFSKEQVEKAKQTSLEQYLLAKGERLQRAGSEFKWIYTDSTGEHDSVMVRNNQWFDHKKQIGGDTIGFLQEYMGCDFIRAVCELTGESSIRNKGKISQIRQTGLPDKAPPQQKEFELPQAASHMRGLFAYLIKTRLIAPDIVEHFVHAGVLYQEKEHNNIVFVAKDETEKACAGTMKGINTYLKSFKQTISGSQTEYGFCHKGSGTMLFVFEAPVDLLSYLTLYPENWQEQSYVALDGLSPKAMLHFVKQNPNINEVFICTDHDEAGIEAYDKHKDKLKETGYTGRIYRLLPTHKDWNEMLKAQAGLQAIPAQEHPKIKAVEQLIQNLCYYGVQESRQEYLNSFSSLFAQKGVGFLQQMLKQEMTPFQKIIKKGTAEEIQSKQVQSHLIRMTDTCFLAYTEIKCSEKASWQKKKETYRHAVYELIPSYKPYQDKGKLQQRHTQWLKELRKLADAMQGQEKNQLAQALKDFAGCCIRMKIYIDVEYTFDLEQQNQIVNQKEQQKSLSM